MLSDQDNLSRQHETCFIPPSVLTFRIQKNFIEDFQNIFIHSLVDYPPMLSIVCTWIVTYVDSQQGLAIYSPFETSR